jgi:glycosyltransferase involved in cell wall biosynthesis
MTILHVISSMDPVHGGVCQAVRGLIEGCASTPDCVNEVVCLDDPSSDFLKNDRMAVHAVGQGRGPWWRNPALATWLRNNLERYDVVVIHGLWQYHTFAARRALRRLANNKRFQPRYFLMPHGMLDPWFQQYSHRPIKALRNLIFWKLTERHIVNGATGLLFTCEEERRLASLSFRPYRPQSERVIGLGIVAPPAYDSKMKSAFAELVPSIGEDAFLLFLGRLHSKKGLDLLLRAFGQISSTNGHSQGDALHLVVAGPCADRNYLAELKRITTSLPNAARVHFIDMINGDAKWGAFYLSDAFALPSHQENFGIAVAEAMACHVPVLISNKVNIWREINAGGAGLVDDDTLAGTVRLLNRWVDLSPECKLNMRRDAESCFAERFEIHEVSRMFVETVTVGEPGSQLGSQ